MAPKFLALAVIALSLSNCGLYSRVSSKSGGQELNTAGAPSPLIEIFDVDTSAGESAVHVGQAPVTVHVRLPASDPKLVAGLLGGGSILDARIHWSFGDTATQRQVFNRALNKATIQYNPNELDGAVSAHLFEKPGTYTLTLNVTNAQGLHTQVTRNIIVDENRRHRVCIANNQQQPSDGKVCNERHASAAELGALTSNTEYLFGTGEQFTVPQNTLQLIGVSDVIIGALGTGPRPVLMWEGERRDTNSPATPSNRAVAGSKIIGIDPASKRVLVRGLSFDSPFAAISATDTAEDLPMAILVRGNAVTVADNTFLNTNYVIGMSDSPRAVFAIGNESPLATGLRAYFSWLDGSELVFVGNYVENSTREHILRSSSPALTDVAIEYNDFQNLDRADQGDNSDQIKTTINIRAGHYVTIDKNILRGGTVGFGPTKKLSENAGDGEANGASWIAVRGNQIANATLSFVANCNHVMVSGNKMMQDGTELISIQMSGWAEDADLKDIHIVGNVGFQSSDSGKFLKLQGSGHNLRSIELTANILHAPNLKLGLLHTVVHVEANNLGDFSSISKNVWPIPSANAKSPQTASLFQIGNQTLNLGDWNKTSPVSDDLATASDETAFEPAITEP